MNEIGIIEFDYDNNVICTYGEKEWHDYSISELKDYLNDIQSQLQSYKDKEDKLRELVKTYSCRFNKGFPYDKVCIFQGDISIKNEYLDLQIIINEFLKILNEGEKVSDENA